MNGNVEVRRFRRTDEADAIRLLVAKLPPAEREGAFEPRRVRWAWQYYGNPNNPDGEPLIWVAEVAGRFAGMVATVPVRLMTPGGTVLGMWGVDFVVDGSMRGKGIGKALLVEWLKTSGVAFVRGWSPVSFKVASGVGFKLLWGFTSATVALSRLRFGTMLLRASRRKELAQLVRVCLLPNRRSGPHSGRVVVSRALPPSAGGLWREVAGAYRFAVERNDAYMRWRFQEHPTHAYNFVEIEEAGALAGLAVARLTDRDPPLGIVSDLIVHPGRKRIMLALVDETLAFLKSRGACAALIDLPPAVVPEVLGRYRCSVRQEFGMIIHAADEGLVQAGIFDRDSWFQARSDSDEDY